MSCFYFTLVPLDWSGWGFQAFEPLCSPWQCWILAPRAHCMGCHCPLHCDRALAITSGSQGHEISRFQGNGISRCLESNKAAGTGLSFARALSVEIYLQLASWTPGSRWIFVEISILPHFHRMSWDKQCFFLCIPHFSLQSPYLIWEFHRLFI